MNLGPLLRALVLAPLTIAFVATTACGAFGADDADSVPAGDEELPPGAPAPVQTTPDPSEVTEAFGYFVTEAGDDAAPGTRERPFRSIHAAIAAAKPNARRVYVCRGTYPEDLVLEDAVSVIGGYDCSSPAEWKRAPGDRSTVPAPGPLGLRATDIVRTTRFEGFEVRAADATEPGASSVGLWAERASKLVVADAKIVAGRGADGSAGVASAPADPGPSTAGAAATAGVYNYGEPIAGAFPYPGARAGGVSACGGQSGGAGGRGGVFVCELPIPPSLRNRLVEAQHFVFGQLVYVGLTTLPVSITPKTGDVGLDGPSASAPGRLARGGFVPTDGVAGENGGPGSGGSGGTAENHGNVTCTLNLYTTVQAGPGGGAGGCGGLAGSPGKGGGASIGAFVVDSADLSFDAVTIEGGRGGDGGAGSFGADPTLGGEPGAAGTGTGVATPGAPGGRAGVSGSGAGGSSYGLAVTGGEPKILAGTTTKAGTPGEGVAAMDQINAISGQPAHIGAAVAGIAKDVESF